MLTEGGGGGTRRRRGASSVFHWVRCETQSISRASSPALCLNNTPPLQMQRNAARVLPLILRVARSVNNKINTTSISFSFCLSVLRNSSAASRPLRLCSVFTLSFSRPRWSGSTGFASVCCDLVSFSGLSFDFTCCVAAGEHCLFCCRWHGYLIQVEELLLHFWKIPILSSHLVFIWLPCKTGN